jgi:probable HAF family extracellular repeat protein
LLIPILYLSLKQQYCVSTAGCPILPWKKNKEDHHEITPGLNFRGFILATVVFAGLGFGTSASAQYHSYLIDVNSKKVTDIGTLGGTGPNDYSAPRGINNAGQVVGWSYTASGGQYAFITGPNGVGIMDLNSLADMPDGVVLIAATGINDAGQIIAEGYASIIPESEVYGALSCRPGPGRIHCAAKED